MSEKQVNKPSLPTDENTLSLIPHVLGFIFPLFGPLIMYLIYKETATPTVKQNIINAFNFQASISIYGLVLAITIIGMVLVPILGLVSFVLSILGAIEASKGGVYKYPLTIELIKE